MNIIYRLDKILESLEYKKGILGRNRIKDYTEKDNFTLCYRNEDEDLDWDIIIEHKNVDTYYSKIRFEFFNITSNYCLDSNINLTYFDYRFCYTKKSNKINTSILEKNDIEYEAFLLKCLNILKEKLPNSFRKLKIKQILEE